MPTSPDIIQMNITRYGAMLKSDLDDAKRSVLERLLAEAKKDLALTKDAKK